MTVATDARWLDDPVECGESAGFGIYVHVPFCAHRCGYCDFATVVPDGDDLMTRYVDAVGTEIAAAPADAPKVTSVFVGGGTPTLLPAGGLTTVLDQLRHRFDIDADAEVTVECNPETASPALFTELATAGVTRLSMGAQSFVPHVLDTLERSHGAERPVAAVAMARDAGIAQISLDLLYGTPGERDQDWVRSLEQVLAAGVDHVSAYALTIHANTPFGRAVSAGRMPDVDDDVQRARFDVAHAMLATGGFEHYEISNWALGTRARSRHNLLYWRHGEYLGFGIGAHSHRHGRRWWNTRSIHTYLAAIGRGDPVMSGSEPLDQQQRAVERLMLGLRVAEGLHPIDVPPIHPLALEDAVTKGLVSVSCGRLQCTEDGWFLLDEAVRLLA